MQRFKNILVVYQNGIGDEATLGRATELAKRNGARLTLVEVLEVEAATSTDFVEQRRSHLERIAESVRVAGVPFVLSDVLVGTPFLEVTRRVLLHGHDLVMMTADGLAGGLKRVLFGSTSMHLMRKCPCPVWVSQGPSQTYRRVLAAVDPGVGPGERESLNSTILQLAGSLARQEKSELHIVHAWELLGRERDTLHAEMTEPMRAELLCKAAEPHGQRLQALIDEHDLDGVRYRTRLLQGPPETVIPDYAVEEQVDLIVMGTICRTGVPGFLIGNTAETVLGSVDCAVLTVKPSGFVTPVTSTDGIPLDSPKAASG